MFFFFKFLSFILFALFYLSTCIPLKNSLRKIFYLLISTLLLFLMFFNSRKTHFLILRIIFSSFFYLFHWPMNHFLIEKFKCDECKTFYSFFVIIILLNFSPTYRWKVFCTVPCNHLEVIFHQINILIKLTETTKIWRLKYCNVFVFVYDSEKLNSTPIQKECLRVIVGVGKILAAEKSN